MTKQKSDPTDFILTPVHDKTHRDYTRSRNASSWKNLLSVEDYVAREHVLGLSKIASSDINRLLVFALSAKNEPGVTLCSCELLIRESWKYTKDENGQVKKETVLSGCVGGVYTFEENRGRGLATIMIDQLVAIARSPDYLGEEGFVFLYSEVGEFYSRNGFKSFPVDLLELPLSSSQTPYSTPKQVQLIKFNEFDDLFKTYRQQFDQHMIAQVQSDGIARVTVGPSADIVEWFHLRAKYFGVKLFETEHKDHDFLNESAESISAYLKDAEPTYLGLQISNPETNTLEGFIAWQYDYEFDVVANQFKNHATVIKIVVYDGVSDKNAVALELLLKMKEFLEAKHDAPQMQNFHKIILWESEISPAVLRTLLKCHHAVHGLENSSRSAILMNDSKEDAALRSGKLIWENNTKLPWF